MTATDQFMKIDSFCDDVYVGLVFNFVEAKWNNEVFACKNTQ